MNGITSHNLILALSMLVFVQSTVTPVKDVDLHKLSGVWFEVYSSLFPQASLPKAWACVTAQYVIRDSQTMDLFYNGRLGSPLGQHFNLTGTAKVDNKISGLVSVIYNTFRSKNIGTEKVAGKFSVLPLSDTDNTALASSNTGSNTTLSSSDGGNIAMPSSGVDSDTDNSESPSSDADNIASTSSHADNTVLPSSDADIDAFPSIVDNDAVLPTSDADNTALPSSDADNAALPSNDVDHIASSKVDNIAFPSHFLLINKLIDASIQNVRVNNTMVLSPRLLPQTAYSKEGPSIQLEQRTYKREYTIVKLGPPIYGAKNMYEYAVITTPTKLSLEVLTRDIQRFQAYYIDEVFQFLKAKGFVSRWNRPIVVHQGSDCQYPEYVEKEDPFSIVDRAAGSEEKSRLVLKEIISNLTREV